MAGASRRPSSPDARLSMFSSAFTWSERGITEMGATKMVSTLVFYSGPLGIWP